MGELRISIRLLLLAVFVCSFTGCVCEPRRGGSGWGNRRRYSSRSGGAGSSYGTGEGSSSTGTLITILKFVLPGTFLLALIISLVYICCRYCIAVSVKQAPESAPINSDPPSEYDNCDPPPPSCHREPEECPPALGSKRDVPPFVNSSGQLYHHGYSDAKEHHTALGSKSDVPPFVNSSGQLYHHGYSDAKEYPHALGSKSDVPPFVNPSGQLYHHGYSDNNEYYPSLGSKSDVPSFANSSGQLHHHGYSYANEYHPAFGSKGEVNPSRQSRNYDNSMVGTSELGMHSTDGAPYRFPVA